MKNAQKFSLAPASFMVVIAGILAGCGFYAPQTSPPDMSQDIWAECRAGTTRCIPGNVKILDQNSICASAVFGEFLDSYRSYLGPAYTDMDTTRGVPISKVVVGNNIFFPGLYKNPSLVKGVKASCLDAKKNPLSGSTFFDDSTPSITIFLQPATIQ